MTHKQNRAAINNSNLTRDDGRSFDNGYNLTSPAGMQEDCASKKYFIIENAFGDMQCLLCYKTFKQKRNHFFKNHFETIHSAVNEKIDEEKELLFKKQKKNC